MANREILLVSAPNVAGEEFVKLLKLRHIPFAAIANNPYEIQRLSALGATDIIKVNTTEKRTWIVPDIEVGKVYLFERSLPLACRYIQICRSWTAKSIYVITSSSNPRLVYKGLGADYVIHSSSLDHSFLLPDDSNAKS